MKVNKKLAKRVIEAGIITTLLTGSLFKKELIGGTNYANVMENGKLTKIEVPVYPLWKVGPNNCSLYSRLITEKFGNKINKGCAWDLPSLNKSSKYNLHKLSKGDIVLFYNPTSSYNNKEREGTHVACYLGTNKKGEELFAEERGYKTKITTINKFKKKGFKPIKIIYPKKDSRSLDYLME
ncbi:MAG: hypothetical protein U9Q99_00990 [Nanoarchaeota archaeon]|nr:hypothetical protein [Nanoarchaeota archaeon]